MTTPPNLQPLNESQLRALAEQLMAQVAETEQENHQLASKNRHLESENHHLESENHHLKQLNDKLTHEMALLKRHRYGSTSEKLHPLQISLLGDLVDADMAGIEAALEEAVRETPAAPTKKPPKRKPLPAELPRTIIRHEPNNTDCDCGCQRQRIGEDISEKLDYTPGTFTVERHVRGKWVCPDCDTLTQAPVPAHVIDKGLPTAGLLAYVLIAKYADHLPLYRLEQIFTRAGVALSRSTLAEWVGRCGVALEPLVEAMREDLLQCPILHADESPVPMLKPGKKKTHKAYIWAYANTDRAEHPAVVYHFSPSRAGEHARAFLQDWQGQLVCDDYSGYKASFAQGVTEIGCLAHARRKFHDLHVSGKSQLAEQALVFIHDLYAVEREAASLDDESRLHLRQDKSQPLLDSFYQWLVAQRQKIPSGTASAKAIDYTLKRWAALTRYSEDGAIPIDNNRIENLIRPWALGRKNWLFAGSLRSGERAANIMSLIQSAKLSGHDPYAYLKDVLERLPTQRNNQLEELLPYHWQPAVNA